MRDTYPVWHDPKTGIWNVYRYADVAAVLADHRTFSSDFSEVLPSVSAFSDGNLVAMDPPRHHQFRSLVSQAFTPRAIARLAPRIEEITEKLLDRVGDRTRIELVKDLAYPLPMTVIAELLGVPVRDRGRFKAWADALLSQDSVDPTNQEAIELAAVNLRKFQDYLTDLAQRRRRKPRPDLLSDLVAAEIDGQRLGDPEIAGFAAILLIAGHVTTTSLLGNTLLCLDEHPNDQDALHRDPAKIPQAIEEALRYRSPVTQVTRVTTREVQLGDQIIAPRQILFPWLISANHDERQFTRPDDFIVDRHPNPHLAFGKGIHFCLGAPLARMEAQIALGVLLRRFSHLSVDPAFPPEPYADPGFNGMKALHLLAEPAL
jgi:cytochrome P450